MVFTDASAKRVHGWDQAMWGYLGDGGAPNFAYHEPVGNPQSNNRAELLAGLQAARDKQSADQLVVVMD